MNTDRIGKIVIYVLILAGFIIVGSVSYYFGKLSARGDLQNNSSTSIEMMQQEQLPSGEQPPIYMMQGGRK